MDAFKLKKKFVQKMNPNSKFPIKYEKEQFNKLSPKAQALHKKGDNECVPKWIEYQYFPPELFYNKTLGRNATKFRLSLIALRAEWRKIYEGVVKKSFVKDIMGFQADETVQKQMNTAVGEEIKKGSNVLERVEDLFIAYGLDLEEEIKKSDNYKTAMDLERFNQEVGHKWIQKIETSHTCNNCNKLRAINKCSRCKSAWYCDASCQKDAWPIHKKECKASE
jgi:hypothetical protein